MVILKNILGFLNRRNLILNKVFLGHGIMDNWNSENKFAVLKIYSHFSFFDIYVTILEVRRVIIFLIDCLQNSRWMRFLAVSGLPYNKSYYKVKFVKECFESSSIAYVFRWVPGFLTNKKIMLDSFFKSFGFKKLKGYGLKKKRRMTGSSLYLQLVQNTNNLFALEGCLPNLIFFFSVSSFLKVAVHETKRLHIPSVGIVDTDGDSGNVSYPVHGNDDSISSFLIFFKIFKNCVDLGRLKSFKIEKMKIDYTLNKNTLNKNTLNKNTLNKNNLNKISRKKRKKVFSNILLKFFLFLGKRNNRLIKVSKSIYIKTQVGKSFFFKVI